MLTTGEIGAIRLAIAALPEEVVLKGLDSYVDNGFQRGQSYRSCFVGRMIGEPGAAHRTEPTGVDIVHKALYVNGLAPTPDNDGWLDLTDQQRDLINKLGRVSGAHYYHPQGVFMVIEDVAKDKNWTLALEKIAQIKSAYIDEPTHNASA